MHETTLYPQRREDENYLLRNHEVYVCRYSIFEIMQKKFTHTFFALFLFLPLLVL